MLPSTIFRNPKAALLWAGLVCWGAVEFASDFKPAEAQHDNRPARIASSRPATTGPPAPAADSGAFDWFSSASSSHRKPHGGPMIRYDSDGDGTVDSIAREVQ